MSGLYPFRTSHNFPQYFTDVVTQNAKITGKHTGGAHMACSSEKLALFVFCRAQQPGRRVKHDGRGASILSAGKYLAACACLRFWLECRVDKTATSPSIPCGHVIYKPFLQRWLSFVFLWLCGILCLSFDRFSILASYFNEIAGNTMPLSFTCKLLNIFHTAQDCLRIRLWHITFIIMSARWWCYLFPYYMQRLLNDLRYTHTCLQ